MRKPFLIIDTNVLIAGVISSSQQSPVVKLVDAMLSGEILFLLSAELLAEYRQVLLRPKLSKLHGLREDEVDQLLTEITANGIWREPPETENAPDLGDNHLWNLLRQNTTALLVTGDKLLLDNPPHYASVISPSTCVANI